MGEIKYTIDETDRRRGGKKSKKNRVDGVDVLENEIERIGSFNDKYQTKIDNKNCR